MAIVQRANVVLEVSDEDISKYLAKGFRQLDKSGHIIQEPSLNDVTSLKTAYLNSQQEIKSLKDKLAKLEEELELAVTENKALVEKLNQPKEKTRSKKAAKAVEEVVDEDVQLNE